MDMGSYDQWFENEGDYTHRLNYNLNEQSIVFDLGGYQGWFTDQINKKYKSKIFCFEPLKKYSDLIESKFDDFNNVLVFNLAVSNKNGKNIIYVDNDASSIHVKKSESEDIDCITLDKIMIDLNINRIDLIKINIEGDEYPLLEYMIDKNIIEKCDNIQVQFHITTENYNTRYENIKKELEKSHHLTYRYPFIWENWKKN